MCEDEDIQVEDSTPQIEEIVQLKQLYEQVEKDAPKGLEGNKQAARRARKALNEIKKMTVPFRTKIQEAVKKARE